MKNSNWIFWSRLINSQIGWKPRIRLGRHIFFSSHSISESSIDYFLQIYSYNFILKYLTVLIKNMYYVLVVIFHYVLLIFIAAISTILWVNMLYLHWTKFTKKTIGIVPSWHKMKKSIRKWSLIFPISKLKLRYFFVNVNLNIFCIQWAFFFIQIAELFSFCCYLSQLEQILETITDENMKISEYLQIVVDSASIQFFCIGYEF